MLRDKVRKLQNLANRGATDGEREAAKHALNRLRERYGDELDKMLIQDELPVSDHYFRYWTVIDEKVLRHAIFHMNLTVYTTARRRKLKKLACTCDEPTALIVEELYNYHRERLERLTELFCQGYLFEAMPLPENRVSGEEVEFSSDERAAVRGGMGAGERNQKQGRTRLAAGG